MRWIPLLLAASFLTLTVPADEAEARCVGVTDDGDDLVEACAADFPCDGVYVGPNKFFYGTCQEPSCNVVYVKSTEVGRLCWI